MKQPGPTAGMYASWCGADRLHAPLVLRMHWAFFDLSVRLGDDNGRSFAEGHAMIDMTRKELLRMMPATGDDLPAATRIVEMGYPAVGPVMRDMVGWMRVAESPVPDAFAVFFGRLGEPAAPVIAAGLSRGNGWVRHNIFCKVLPAWPPEVIRQLKNILTIVATQPDAYDNDIRSVAVLTKHRLADPEWLKAWVQFKKERLAIRNELLMQVEGQLKNVQPADEG